MRTTGGEGRTGGRALFAEERREQILSLLARDARVYVSELAERFGVSAATLRSDLRELEAAGLLKRTHGGAVAVDSIMTEHPANEAAAEHQVQKRAIAERAAELVHDGDTFFIDSGTTTIELIRALKGRRGLTVLTNDLMIACEAESLLVGPTIVLMGGVVRQGFHYVTGSMADEFANRFSAPVAFMAASAFSFEKGLTVPTTDVATCKRVMLSRCDRHVLLMDSSKFGHYATVAYASMSDFSAFITDDGISDDDRERIQEMPDGPDLIIA